MSVRSWLKETLTIPTGWYWVKEQRVPEVINKVTVVTKHSRIEPLDEAGIGALRHEVILSVFTPQLKVKDAEDALDDAVSDLITELDGHEQIRFVEASKVVSPNEQYFGWDIVLTVITNPEPEEA